MTYDLAWLAKDAEEIHHLFLSIFYALALALLLLGVLLEYFKLPLGELPVFPVLVGRLFIAGVLLHTFPEFANLLRDLTQALADRLGNASQFPIVRAKMGDKFHDLSWSWVSVKESLTMGIAYTAFVLFHLSIYLADACLVYGWTLL